MNALRMHGRRKRGLTIYTERHSKKKIKWHKIFPGDAKLLALMLNVHGKKFQLVHHISKNMICQAKQLTYLLRW